MDKIVTIYKDIGETPLSALERFRKNMVKKYQDSGREKDTIYWRNVPMTYAGRLDPAAEGLLLILIGEECKNKEKYLGLDKEYEMEVIFGINTDTHDALGLATTDKDLQTGKLNSVDIQNYLKKINTDKYLGIFMQKYPPYSSKTVNGKQLHTLARTNDLPDAMPEKEVEIYSIEKICENENQNKSETDPETAGYVEISAEKLLGRIKSIVKLVKGDFRQDQILERWQEIFGSSGGKDTIYPSGRPFYSIKYKVRCSSGTYMRSLADNMGHDLGVGAFAMSIKRTTLGNYKIPTK